LTGIKGVCNFAAKKNSAYIIKINNNRSERGKKIKKKWKK